MVVGGYYQMARKGETLESMMNWHFQKDMILQSRPHFGPEEAEATYRYMSNPDNYLTEYKQTEELERMLCEYIGTKHCIMTTSGNNAIVMALMSLDLKPTDEVIVPNYTMIATINSVRMVGAKPVLVDVDPSTLTLSLDTIRRVRTPHTKVVLHVSLNNRSQDLTEMRAYCDDEGLVLVEDAAQSLGTTIGWQSRVILPEGHRATRVWASPSGVFVGNSRNELTMLRPENGTFVWFASGAAASDSILAVEAMSVPFAKGRVDRFAVATNTNVYLVSPIDGTLHSPVPLTVMAVPPVREPARASVPALTVVAPV